MLVSGRRTVPPATSRSTKTRWLAISIALLTGLVLTADSAPARDQEVTILGVTYSSSGGILGDARVSVVTLSEVFWSDMLLWTETAQVSEVRSDEAGQFTLHFPAARDGQVLGVVARAAGHSPAGRAIRLPITSSELAVAFALEKTAVLEGRVAWLGGQPIRNSPVCIWPTHCGPTLTPPHLPSMWRHKAGDALIIAPTLCGHTMLSPDGLHEFSIVRVVVTDAEGAVRVDGLADRFRYRIGVWDGESERQYVSGETTGISRSAIVRVPGPE